jgi:hypothetical protein
LVLAQEQLIKLKEDHDQAKNNLQNVLEDLQLAIIENQKLNSDKRIDTSNLVAVQAENQDLSRKLKDLEIRFTKFVQESLKNSSRETELLELLEVTEDNLIEKGAKLERELENSKRLKDENDALIEVSLGIL